MHFYNKYVIYLRSPVCSLCLFGTWTILVCCAILVLQGACWVTQNITSLCAAGHTGNWINLHMVPKWLNVISLCFQLLASKWRGMKGIDGLLRSEAHVCVCVTLLLLIPISCRQIRGIGSKYIFLLWCRATKKADSSVLFQCNRTLSRFIIKQKL